MFQPKIPPKKSVERSPLELAQWSLEGIYSPVRSLSISGRPSIINMSLDSLNSSGRKNSSRKDSLESSTDSSYRRKDSLESSRSHRRKSSSYGRTNSIESLSLEHPPGNFRLEDSSLITARKNDMFSMTLRKERRRVSKPKYTPNVPTNSAPAYRRSGLTNSAPTIPRFYSYIGISKKRNEEVRALQKETRDLAKRVSNLNAAISYGRSL